MAAVMDLHRLGVDVRLEGVRGVGEFGQFVRARRGVPAHGATELAHATLSGFGRRWLVALRERRSGGQGRDPRAAQQGERVTTIDRTGSGG